MCFTPSSGRRGFAPSSYAGSARTPSAPSRLAGSPHHGDRRQRSRRQGPSASSSIMYDVAVPVSSSARTPCARQRVLHHLMPDRRVVFGDEIFEVAADQRVDRCPGFERVEARQAENLIADHQCDVWHINAVTHHPVARVPCREPQPRSSTCSSTDRFG